MKIVQGSAGRLKGFASRDPRVNGCGSRDWIMECGIAKVCRCGCFVNRERSPKWALNLLGLVCSLRGSRKGLRVARLVFLGKQVVLRMRLLDAR